MVGDICVCIVYNFKNTHTLKSMWMKVIFNDFINLDFLYCTQFFCAKLTYELNDFEAEIIRDLRKVIEFIYL